MGIYLENARREIAKADARAGKYNGPCSECEWRRSGVVWAKCVHPAVKVAQLNTEPSYADNLGQCDQQRGSRSVWGAVVCGPDGELFSPKVGFWERLFA